MGPLRCSRSGPSLPGSSPPGGRSTTRAKRPFAGPWRCAGVGAPRCDHPPRQGARGAQPPPRCPLPRTRRTTGQRT